MPDPRVRELEQEIAATGDNRLDPYFLDCGEDDAITKLDCEWNERDC